jgi:adenylate cyclase
VLHAGDSGGGELGSLRKESALIGDPMNTAARMLDACRDLDRPALASTALLSRLDRLPAAIEATPFAPLPLRGKSEPLALFALEAGVAAAPAAVLVRTE